MAKKVQGRKKLGRPKARNPKNIEVKTHVTAKMGEAIDRYCEANGISRSEFFRIAIKETLKNSAKSKKDPSVDGQV